MTVHHPSFEEQVLKIHRNIHRCDYYFLLGLTPDSTTQKVSEQYQKVSVHFSPSIHANADPDVRLAVEVISERLHEAYRILTDAQKRAVYDEQRSQGAKRYSQPPSPEQTLRDSGASKPIPSSMEIRRAIAPVRLASGRRASDQPPNPDHRNSIPPRPPASMGNSSSEPPAPVRHTNSAPPQPTVAQTRSSSRPPTTTRHSSVPPLAMDPETMLRANAAAFEFYVQALQCLKEGNYSQAQLHITMSRAKLLNYSNPLIEQLVVRIHELRDRIVNLSDTQQRQVANSDSKEDRMALERTYGSRVWSLLLENPNLTIQEVTRIALQKNISQEQLLRILRNTNWRADNDVQRALLWNPVLESAQIAELLASMPPSTKMQILNDPACPIRVKKAAG